MFLNAFVYHVKKKTPLGRAFMKDPIQALFFLLKGNLLIAGGDWIDRLHRRYAYWRHPEFYKKLHELQDA